MHGTLWNLFINYSWFENEKLFQRKMIRCINESTNIHKNLFEVGFFACKDIYFNSSSEESGLELDNIHARITIIVL